MEWNEGILTSLAGELGLKGFGFSLEPLGSLIGGKAEGKEPGKLW